MKVLESILKRTVNLIKVLCAETIVTTIHTVALVCDALADHENLDCSKKVCETLVRLSKRF